MTTPRQRLAARLRNDPAPAFAPLCLDALTARIAEAAGFAAGYVSGGALGYAHAVSEALLTLDELADCARHVTARCELPILVDGGVGFGDAVHMTRTVREIEATGAAGIEIEDQVAPKRVSHHRGIEHLVPCADMADKIDCALAARRDGDFLVIARTGAFRNESFAAAVERALAYRAAGADLVMVNLRDAAAWRRAADALSAAPGPPPIAPPRAPAPADLPAPALASAMPLATISALDTRPAAAWQALGVRLVIDPFTAQVLAVEAVRAAYGRFLRDGATGSDAAAVMRAYHELPALAGLDAYYAIEDRRTERGQRNP